MKVRLKKLSCDPRRYKDSHNFQAELWIDGVHCGTVDNDGNGGCHMYCPAKGGQYGEVEKRLHEWAKAQPALLHVSHRGDKPEFDELYSMKPDVDHLVNEELTAMLVTRDFNNKARTCWLFRKATGQVYESPKGLHPQQAYDRIKAGDPDTEFYNDLTPAQRLDFTRKHLEDEEKRSIEFLQALGKVPEVYGRA